MEPRHINQQFARLWEEFPSLDSVLMEKFCDVYNCLTSETEQNQEVGEIYTEYTSCVSLKHR